MGPWSLLATRWLPLPAVFGLKGHSLVFETGAAIPAQAALPRIPGGERRHAVARSCFRAPTAPPMSAPSPAKARCLSILRPSSPDPGAIERLQALCSHISPALARAKVLARQACFRPVTEDGLPLIGAVPGVAGAYVATGHSVWGILNAPATGEGDGRV